MNRYQKLAGMTIVAVACCCSLPRSASAQFEFLRNVFGGKAATPKVYQPFRGHLALSQAVTAAESGDLEKSLQLATDAFRDGGVNEALEHPEIRTIAQNVLRLSKVWEAKGAKPADVTSVLMEIVLPLNTSGIVTPYTNQWAVNYDLNMLSRANGRVPAPESVGAELIRWAVLSRQTDQVRQRFAKVLAAMPSKEPANPGDKPKADAATVAKTAAVVAHAFSVQLSVAERDAESVQKSMAVLLAETPTATAPLLDYLCHAVTAAVREPQFEEAGLRLFEAVLDRAEQSLPAEAGFRVNAPWLRVQVANRHARARRADDAKRCALAAIARPIGGRFGTEYSAYLSQQLKQQAAATLFDAGLIRDGLELAGQALDSQTTRNYRANATVNFAAKTGRELRKLPPAEQFELLRTWALPNDDRDSVQSLIDFVPSDEPAPLGSGILSDVYSTDRELVSTARELGQLDDLIRELGARKPQTPSVQSLLTLAMVVRDGSPAPKGGAAATKARLQALLEATTAAVPQWEMQNKPAPPLDTYVIAVEAAVHPPWREVAQAILFRLLEHGQRAQAARQRDHFRMALLETSRLRSFDILPTRDTDGRAAGPGEVTRHWRKLQPKLWDALGFASATERSMGALPPTWFSHEGYIAHASTGRESDLTFGVPLTGSFELTLECREGGWSEGRVGYGGSACQIYAYQDGVNLTGKGNSGYESGPKMTNLLNKEPWNRYTIRVEGNSVTYYANGQPVFEDQPGSAAPWFTLVGTAGFTPVYRNLRIIGSPTIPREVALLSDSRLRGWISTYFEESKPDALRARRYIQVKVQQNGQTLNYIVEDDGTMEGEPAQVGEAITDWTLTEGELRSDRRSAFFGDASPSWLSYQRPLRNGETVRFECWSPAGDSTIQPTFGETVYTLGETGNKRGKQPTGPQGETGGREIASGMLSNRLCAGELRTGWNTVVLSLRDEMFTIELNDKEVVSEKIDPVHSRRFGIFHDAASSAVRLRNLVLTGDWPKAFDTATRVAMESPVPVENLANTRFLTAMLNETYISDNAYEVARQAVQLSASEQYQFLHRWVIPNESHDLLRTSGAFTSTHPVPSQLHLNPIDVAMAEMRQSVDRRMVQTGGNFVCPAILLVLAAAELDRLAELREEVAALDPSSSGEMARNRAAMLGLIHLLEDRPDQVVERIRECQALMVLHKETAIYSRWGDVALASLAIQHPDTRDAAFELLTAIQSQQLQSGNPGKPEFSRFVRQLHGQCLALMYGAVPDEFGTQPKSKQWRTVSQPRARSRGTGYPIAAFDVIAGELAQRGGHEFDAAYFQSPLRGNYEVTCRLTHYDWREAMLMAGGIANSLEYSHSKVRATHPMKMVQEFPLLTPIAPKVFQWHDYKVVVNDGEYTSYVNGQKLYGELLPPEHDPWLAVVGWAGHSTRAARDIVIRGEPVIPQELDLLGSPDLRGWMTDYFAAEWGQAPFEWKLDQGELTSPQTVDANPARDRRKVENILRYHRPLLEDGEIRYEFFYDPEVKLAAPASNQLSYLGTNAPKRAIKGKAIVHPALDRMVCLLEPDGVRIHWLTNGRWDRTGLTADNLESQAANADAATERSPKASKALPLKPREWNSIQFRTKGDTLTVELNGEIVLTRDIEPTNLRHFGLFHYANESAVQVRNLRYRGEWPTSLPSVADQELAGEPQFHAVIPDASLRESVAWDFTKSQFPRNEFRWVWDSRAEKYIAPSEAGLRFAMPAGEAKPQVAGIAPKIQISGDFIATMEYENLKTVAGAEQWGSGIGFNVTLDGSYQMGIEIREGVKSSAKKATNASQTIYVSNRPHLFLNDSLNEFATSGRLRLQRKGPVLYYLIAKPGSENFRLITQRPAGTQDIKHLAINADASDSASGSTFTVKNLSIRAAKIVVGK